MVTRARKRQSQLYWWKFSWPWVMLRENLMCHRCLKCYDKVVKRWQSKYLKSRSELSVRPVSESHFFVIITHHSHIKQVDLHRISTCTRDDATEGHRLPSDDKRVESVVDLVEAVCVQSFGKRADGRTLLKSKLPLLILHQYTQPPSPFKSVQCWSSKFMW